jgi:hypothetical protein
MIASEVMDMIERERRINKDDLILAADMAIRKHERQVEAAHPAFVYDARLNGVQEPSPHTVFLNSGYMTLANGTCTQGANQISRNIVQLTSNDGEGFTHPCTGEFLPFEPRKL